MGLDIAVLDTKQTQALEPEAELNVLGAVHYRCDAHLSPNQLVKQLIAYLRNNEVEIISNCKVNGFEITGRKIKNIRTDQAVFYSDLVVMTAGAWLPELTKKAGLNVPVMPGKGYSFMVDPIQNIQHPALLLEAKVAVTPMNGQIRFGGTMEIGKMNHQINRNRLQGIVESIPNYYPGFKVEMPALQNVWHGFRPCSPDGLPYIGFSDQVTNLIVAGGHGMMGLSLAPATGKLVSELASANPLSADIRIFDIARFT
ncbi:D-amino acid dehydrogenase [compost metagenome]